MFHVINMVSDRPDDVDILRVYKDLFHCDVDFSQQDIKIIYRDRNLGILGGLSLDFCYLKHFMTDCPPELASEKVWLGTDLVFEIENKAIYECPKKFGHYCKTFYQGLFKTLEAFAKTRGIEEMYTYLWTEDHRDVVYFGAWPFEASFYDPATYMTFSKLRFKGAR